MLVLSRRAGQEIWIDGRIRVVVLSAGSGRVRLGIEAPRTVPVWRQELLKPADGCCRRASQRRLR